jgi:PKD repeat protein
MKLFRNAILLLAASAVAVAVGCTSSPTEPKGGGGVVTPKPPATLVTYNVTVTANPSQIVAGGTGLSNISISVVRSDTGQAPPDGSTVAVTTTLGGFNSIGGPQSVSLQLVNGKAATTLFAGTDVGTATVRAAVTNANNVVVGSGAANVRIGQAASFYVSSVSPNTGDSAGGQTVTILGGGFVQPVQVTFNNAAATVRSVTPSQIVVVTPSAAAAGVPVVVGQTATASVTVTIHANQTNQAQDTLPAGFTYSVGGGGGGQPQVFSVTPASGTNDGGTRVTITGTGFQSPVQVLFGIGASATTFNGVEATVVSVTPTQIVVITPSARGIGQNLSNQVVDILVKNVNSGFSTVGGQQFKYGTAVQITALQGPGSGPASGGTTLTVLGNGFNSPVTVSLHFKDANINVPQLVTNTTGTQVVFLTSAAPRPTTCPPGGIIGTDSITVTNVDNGDSATANIGFNFLLPLPSITSISPASGGTGAIVTITGVNFPANPSVLFGDPVNGSTATVQSSNGTQVRVAVPNPPTGFTFNTQPCGASNSGTMKVPTPINITVKDTSTGCVSTFNNGFLLSPEDSSCQGATQPPAPVASFTAAPVSGHTIQFSDTSTGPPTSWSWDFGDGNGSAAENPSHTYAAAGNYAVKLTVSNAGGSSQAVMVVTVP